jgi:ferredoxin
MGDKRSSLRFALRELHIVAPAPVDVIDLPAGAPFGAVEIDTPNCTLCLSCVSACPTGALRDDPDQPMLRFAEEACVQCGLCQATCPEKVITLRPRLNFRATSNGVQVLKAEEPFSCVSCRKPFGVKSTIEKVLAKLTANQHWMFKDAPERLELIKMCDDCRVAYVTEREFDPHNKPRPPMRTTDDYLRERDARDPGDSDDR